MHEIRTFEELQHVLGDEYVLFCGSAVSSPQLGSKTAFSPMVGNVYEGLFTEIADRFEDLGGAYYRLLARDTRTLIPKPGGEKTSLDETKFETLIGFLQDASNEHAVGDLLHRLFFCDASTHNYNHLAIAKLLKSGTAARCLTTNFDNGIENASGLIPWVHKHGHTPDDSRILKLHGDATTGAFVATTRTLLEFAGTRDYDYVRTLLAGKTVLFLGYSALGDIDIAPRLYEVIRSDPKTKFVWVVRGQPAPSMASHFVPSNLWVTSVDGKLEDTNCLLKLAGIDATSMGVCSGPDWQGQFNKWVRTAEIGWLESVVGDVYGTHDGRVPLHWFHARRYKPLDPPHDPELDTLYQSVWCTSAGNYATALRFARDSNACSDELRAAKAHWIGFALWRLLQYDEAIESYQYAIQKWEASDPSSQWDDFGAGYVRINHGDMRCRILEVLIDKLTFTGRRPGKDELKHLESSLGLLPLITVLQDENRIAESWQLLHPIIAHHAAYLLGDTPNIARVDALFNMAKDLKESVAAFAGARMLLAADFSLGRKRKEEITPQLQAKRMTSHIRQLQVAEQLERFRPIPGAATGLSQLLRFYLQREHMAHDRAYSEQVIRWRAEFEEDERFPDSTRPHLSTTA